MENHDKAYLNKQFEVGKKNVWEDVQQPKDLPLNEWLAMNICRLFKETMSIYNTITKGICNANTCKVMSGGPKYEYHWSDKEIVKPIVVSAPQYVSLLNAWVKKQTENEELFPTTPGAIFPENFRDICKQICRRLWRVYVHIFWHHFEKITSSGNADMLNTHFKDNFAFVYTYDMVGSADISPVEELIENLFKNDTIYQAKKEHNPKEHNSKEDKPKDHNPKEDKPKDHNPKEHNPTEDKPEEDEKKRRESIAIEIKQNDEENKKKEEKGPTVEVKLMVEFEGVKRRCDANISSVEELRSIIEQKFDVKDIPDLLLEYYDEEFQDFAVLDELKHLKEGKGRLQLRSKPVPKRNTLPRNFKLPDEQKVLRSPPQTRSPRPRTTSSYNVKNPQT